MQKSIGFLTAIFLTNFVGMYFGMYSIWWFDISLHFFGGFFMAMLMFYYLADVKVPTKLKHYLLVGGAVSFIGVVWEFAEYLAALTLIEPLREFFNFNAYFIGDLDDTMNDLLMDIVGAFSWLVIFRRK